MSAKTLSASRARQILAAAQKTRVLVVGDVMLDQFIWGGVSRISPEAPVPVVDFSRESFMPGGAANVARNLVSLKTPAELFGAIGKDDAARKLLKLLGEQNIGCTGLVKSSARHTSIKTRIVAHQQQVVRIDRETRDGLDEKLTARSPLEKYEDLESDLRDKWEDELTAAIEAEYRRRRADLLRLVQAWLRDIWLRTLAAGETLLAFPQVPGAEAVARRISARQARENLMTLEHIQRLLHTNVQESLALEVGLLKLHF